MPKVNFRARKTKNLSRYLTLPQELRQYIYQNILHTMPSSLFELLRTNRQISDEVKPVMYKQQIDLDGQLELFDWLRDADRECLKYVEDISFKLHDIDPEKIVGALGKRLRQSTRDRDAQSPPEDNPYREACELEVQRISQSLSLLPNVKKFTLRRCTVSDPQPPRHMQLAFTKSLITRFPKLQDLASYDESFSLKILPSFRKLEKFSFMGITATDPASMREIFSKTEDLVDLEIFRPDPNVDDSKFQQRAGRPEMRRCNPVEILESLPYSLQAFTFHEMTRKARLYGIGHRMVNALESIVEALEDHANLHFLELLSSARVDSSIKARLASFISSTPLKDLDLFVEDFLSFDMLPSSIIRIVWRFSRPNTPSVPFITGLLSNAQEHRARLSHLAEIVIFVDQKPVDKEVRHHQQRAVESMRRLGISLCWESWDAPSKFDRESGYDSQ